MNLEKPITIKLEASWIFSELPDDFEGTREDAIDYFKSDLVNNFGEFFDTRYVSQHLTIEGETK